MPTAGDLVINFLGRHEQFSKTAANVRAELGKTAAFAKSTASAVGSALSSIPAIGGLLSVGGIAAGIASIVREMDDMADAADRLSVSVEFFQKLSLAGKGVGLGADAMASSLDKMQKSIMDALNGSQQAKSAFDALGLSAQFLQRIGAEEAFMMLARALQRVHDPMERTRLEMAVLSESGPKMRLAMNEAAEGFERFRDAVASKQTVEDLAAVNDAWDTFAANAKKNSATVIAAAARAYQEASGPMQSLAKGAAFVLSPAAVTLGSDYSQPSAEADATATAALAARQRQTAELEKQNRMAKALEDYHSAVNEYLKEQAAKEKEITELQEQRLRESEAVQQDLAQRAEAIAKAVRTPLEELHDTMAELEGLRSFGLISDETFARASLEAQAKRLAAEKGEGEAEKKAAPKLDFAGAMERGSSQAWSTILANMGGRGGDDEVKRLSREQVRAQKLIERNTARLYEALREQRAGLEGEELFP